jgi:IS605 OrfB family transposase
MLVTSEARIRPDESGLYPKLNATADLLCQTERWAYRELYQKHREAKDVKREALVKFGITGRQFNGISQLLRGMVAAQKTALFNRKDSLENKLGRVQKKIEEATDKFALHQHRRREALLKSRLNKVAADIKSPPGICFGGRKLFIAGQRDHYRLSQFSNRKEWKRKWSDKRSNHFYLVGSHEELMGNQSCTFQHVRWNGSAGGLSGILRVRLPNSSDQKHLMVPVVFRHRASDLHQALLLGKQPISFRFLRRENGSWYVQATTEAEIVPAKTSRRNGTISVDLNPDCLACIRLDGAGNKVDQWVIPLRLRGLSTGQRKNLMGRAITRIVLKAEDFSCPISIEDLDFTAKKKVLRGRNCNRMLSSFAYQQFHQNTASACARRGVELLRVNPAYTSKIGRVKYAKGYGLSAHLAAALVIGRRGLQFSEKVGIRTGSAHVLPEDKLWLGLRSWIERSSRLEYVKQVTLTSQPVGKRGRREPTLDPGRRESLGRTQPSSCSG